MHWFTAIVLYIIIWWLALFLVLPFGTRPVAEPDAITGWRGAPENPFLVGKLIATTILAALIWGGCMVVILNPHWLSFRSGPLALPED